MFFLVSSGFGLGTLPWMPFLPSLFLIVESCTLILPEASEACSYLDVLGSFMTSWESHALGVICVGRPLLGRFTTVPSYHYLWIMALSMVHWSFKTFRNGFETLPRLIHVHYFVCNVFFIFFRMWHDMWLFVIC